ncbi:DNA damage-inducible protein D [Castellaniella sp. UC4442_H9]|jgi:DNA-damage-inducible protein D|nr:DNA damage-inducible protein D [Castellaniella sp.]
MTGKKIEKQHDTTFEGIRHLDEGDNEYWLARDLAPVLDYPQWRNFLPVLEKAQEACRMSGQSVANHFADSRKMVEIGSGARREVDDLRLSRYACYLIVQNGDPSKAVIANGQTYFAIQTRRQELSDDVKFAQLSEDDKRLAIRNELALHNKHLAAVAKDAGVDSPLGKPTRLTSTWAARYAKPSRNWEAPCRKACPCRTTASSRSNQRRRSC